MTVLAVFGHFLKGKPAGLTGKGLAGKGTGQIFLPEGYPGYSLSLIRDGGVVAFSHFSSPHEHHVTSHVQ